MITEVWHAQCYTIDIWYQMRSGLSQYTLSCECSADSQNQFHITSYIRKVVMGNLEQFLTWLREYLMTEVNSTLFQRPEVFKNIKDDTYYIFSGKVLKPCADLLFNKHCWLNFLLNCVVPRDKLVAISVAGRNHRAVKLNGKQLRKHSMLNALRHR